MRESWFIGLMLPLFLIASGIMIAVSHGCSNNEPVLTEDIVNKWFTLEEQELNFLLESPNQLIWYSYLEPSNIYENNIFGGEWQRVPNTNVWTLDYFGLTVNVSVVPIAVSADITFDDATAINFCYHIKYNAFISDMACPYEGVYECE